MKSGKSSKKNILIQDRTNLEELTVAVLGNANSGKSSMVGILTNTSLRNFSKYDFLEKKDFPPDVLDNGNGSSRKNVLQFIHEQNTGRTSSVTYNYTLLNTECKQGTKKERIISFVDLAGHEAYLKTTIKGVTSSYPDFALVCVEKNITKMTLEHIKLLYILEIPFSLIMTKIDIIPEDKLKQNLRLVCKYVKKIDRSPYLAKKYDDISLSIENKKNVPIILLSNKVGIGYNILFPMLHDIKKQKTKIIPNAFTVDHIYNVYGYGTILCGVSGIKIHKGEELMIGPLYSQNNDNVFIKIKIRTLHDDYRNFVDELPLGVRGCLCIKIDNKYKHLLRSGLVIVKDKNDVNPVKKFMANVHIFQGTMCTITPGYNAYVNAGIIKGSVRFNKILKKNEEILFTRGGETNLVELEFIRNSYCLVPGETFVFREGNTVGYGSII